MEPKIPFRERGKLKAGWYPVTEDRPEYLNLLKPIGFSMGKAGKPHHRGMAGILKEKFLKEVIVKYI